MSKVFDFIIGNPPYQGDQQGTSHTTLPVYHDFMSESFDVADKVELITPARFLFNAGQTPKEWNEKMLNDEHFKVLEYIDDAKTVFANTDIKGGVAITYRDATKNYGAIKQFLLYPELKGILQKVNSDLEKVGNIGDIINVATKFNLEELTKKYPQYSNRERRLSSNVLSFECFHENKKSDEIGIYGVINNKRVCKYIERKYIEIADNIDKYKVILPKAEGNGFFGETVTNPVVLQEQMGYTHTFYGIGTFTTEGEANNTLKYTKTRFARTLFSILKVTQNVNADTWKLVPLQDFTNQSDIDWSKSVHEIDLQLYKKYGLDQKEIEFIETHVKEMT